MERAHAAEQPISFLRRFGFFIGYCMFLLLLLEGGLRLAGFLLLFPRQLDRWTHPTTEGEFRILAIGESTTFGLGVDRSMAYPEQLERLLNHGSDKRYVVINMGVPGQTSTSILRNIDHQLQQYRPHLVVSLFGTNDTNEALNDLSSRIVFGFYVPEAIAGLRIYRLTCVLRDYVVERPTIKKNGAWILYDLRQTKPTGEWIQNPFYLEQLELNYIAVIEKIRDYGARPLVISYLHCAGCRPEIHHALHKVVRDTRVSFVDLWSTDVADAALFTSDEFHPNELGHRVIADRIRQELSKQGILPAT